MATGDKKTVVMEFDRGVPNGVATLGEDGLLPDEQLPLQEVTPEEVDEDWDAVMAEEDAAAAQTASVSAPRMLSAAVTAALTELKELKKYLGRAGFRQAVRRIKGELSFKADKQAVDEALADLKKRPYSNPNLLDNWYFVGGGSQQGGGQFPINQRGETEYTGSGYTIDRWRQLGGFVITFVEHGIRLEQRMAGGRTFYQPIENASVYAGKIITATMLLDEVNVENGANLALNINGSDVNLLLNIHTPGLYTATFTLPENLQRFNFQMGMSGSNGGYCIISAVKLELGSVQTLAHKEGDTWVLNDPPPNYALELAKCQRYQEYGIAYIGSVASNSKYRLMTGVTFRTEKRAMPTVTLFGKNDEAGYVLNTGTGFNEAASVARMDKYSFAVTFQDIGVSEESYCYFVKYLADSNL